MVKDIFLIQMAHTMKALGKIINEMAMGNMFGQMVLRIMAIGRMIFQMAKEK